MYDEEYKCDQQENAVHRILEKEIIDLKIEINLSKKEAHIMGSRL